MSHRPNNYRSISGVESVLRDAKPIGNIIPKSPPNPFPPMPFTLSPQMVPDMTLPFTHPGYAFGGAEPYSDPYAANSLKPTPSFEWDAIFPHKSLEPSDPFLLHSPQPFPTSWQPQIETHCTSPFPSVQFYPTPLTHSPLSISSTSSASLSPSPTLPSTDLPDTPIPRRNSNASTRSSDAHKSCSHCGATSTPLWRREPVTLRSLCNACGLYLQQRHKLRPKELIDADAAETLEEEYDPSYTGPECSHCRTHHTSVWRRSKTGAQLCNACGVYQRLRGKDRPLSLKRNRIKPRSKHVTK